MSDTEAALLRKIERYHQECEGYMERIRTLEAALDDLFDGVGDDGWAELREDFWHAVAKCCALSPKGKEYSAGLRSAEGD